MAKVKVVKVFASNRADYPKVDPKDPRFNEIAKRPPAPGVLEEWRFYDVVRSEPEWVDFGQEQQLVFTHKNMACECPVCGPTYLLTVESPPEWPRPSGKGFENMWAVRMACGCLWKCGGLIGGGNRLAGWYRNEDRKSRIKTAVRKTVLAAPAAAVKKPALVKPVAVRKMAVRSSGKDPELQAQAAVARRKGLFRG